MTPGKRKRDSIDESGKEHRDASTSPGHGLTAAFPAGSLDVVVTPAQKGKTKRGKRGRGKGKKATAANTKAAINTNNGKKLPSNGNLIITASAGNESPDPPNVPALDKADLVTLPSPTSAPQQSQSAWEAQLNEYEQYQNQAEAEEEVAGEAAQEEPILHWDAESVPPYLKKYWLQRYSYFSKFDEGIMLDIEGWYSVTPEATAAHIARRFGPSTVVVDAFCGSGGNAIQFALHCKRVIAIDVDPVKITCAKNNARIYGVERKIEFITGDFFTLRHKLKADAVFMSPPWGGPDYLHEDVYDLDHMPLGTASSQLSAARDVADKVALYLPRNVDLDQLSLLAKDETIEVEKNFLNDRCKAFVAYFGGLAKKQ